VEEHDRARVDDGTKSHLFITIFINELLNSRDVKPSVRQTGYRSKHFLK